MNIQVHNNKTLIAVCNLNACETVTWALYHNIKSCFMSIEYSKNK